MPHSPGSTRLGLEYILPATCFQVDGYRIASSLRLVGVVGAEIGPNCSIYLRTTMGDFHSVHRVMLVTSLVGSIQ